MRRVFGYDVLACPRCGHPMRLIALIEQADVVQRILRHLGLPTEVPPLVPARGALSHGRRAEPAPARSPPRLYETPDAECRDNELPYDPAC